jgi:hypothetical protein
MKTVAGLVLLGMLSTVPGRAQTSLTDSQTLQAILAEMRGLRNEARLGQTSQILLAEMLMQQNVVTRAQQKRDEMKNRATQAQDNERNIAAQVARFDENAAAAVDPQQKKQFAQMEEQMKMQMANLKAQEPDRTNDLQDAESALRKEQDTLAGIQEQLNDVVKKLQPAGGR